jgi:hypothetical protein
MSLILALETAEKVIDSLAGYPYARVYINMDSKYVVGKLNARYCVLHDQYAAATLVLL